MVVVEHVGLIALGAALLALAAAGYGAQINALTEPRNRGLLGRLVLGEKLAGLGELGRRGGLSALLFGAPRH